jgi:pimeloyl-ACP methyl ester carboxylesterase
MLPRRYVSIISFTLILLLLAFTGHATAEDSCAVQPPLTPPSFCIKLPPEKAINQWYEYHDKSDIVIIFVHGIFGDIRGTWTYINESALVESKFWPELVSTDKRFHRFGQPSIFLAGYYTDLDSGNFDVSQSAKEVYEALDIQDPVNGEKRVLNKKYIIIVAHSTGGIVARQMLYAFRDSFKNKIVGLVLIASPSYGSKWADRLSLLADIYNNQLAEQLRWKNPILVTLDNNFKDLIYDKMIPKLVGAEAVENHFIVHYKWIPFLTNTLLVDEESGGRYFKSVRVLGNTDHFSTVKPSGLDHVSHKFLTSFFLNDFTSMILHVNVDNVTQISSEITRLRGNYESLCNLGSEAQSQTEDELRKSSPLLGQRLSIIADEKLPLGSRVNKHTMAAYAYVLAVSSETNDSLRQEYAEKIVTLGKDGLKHIAEAYLLASQADSNAVEVVKWIMDNGLKDQAKYLIAIGYAIRSRTNDASAILEFNKVWKEISPSYITAYPPASHPDLDWAVKNILEAKK